LIGLVQAGQSEALEKSWAAEVASAETPRPDLLAALDAVLKVGNPPLAEALAGAWLKARRDALGDSSDPAKLRSFLAVCRELLVRVDTPELRKQTEALYRKLYSGRDYLDAALTASGLNPAEGSTARKTHPKKSVRLLEGMFSLSVGSFLVRRGEDRMGEVTDIAPDTANVTIRTQKGKETLTPGDIADIWEAAHGEDFRVLEQLRPAKLAELAAGNPVALVTSVLRARGNKIDSNQLKKVLVPKHVKTADYDSWWTKVRAALKRDPFIKLEGRSPVTISYDPAGRSPMQDLLAAFEAAKTVDAKIDVLAGYIRDAQRRKETPDPTAVSQMRGVLAEQLAARLAKHPDDLPAALMLDRLEVDSGVESPGKFAARILRSSADPMPLFAKIDDDALYLRALVTAQEVWPETWQEWFVKLLNTTPPAVSDAITARLLEANRADRVNEVIARTFNKPGVSNLAALLWLWKGPSQADKLSVPSKVNLFTKIIGVLDVLGAKEGRTDDETRNAKSSIKSALSARDSAGFRAALEDGDEKIASVMRRQVERCDALGPSLRDDLLRIIREKHPKIFVVPKAPPWEDDKVIWSTGAGLAKRKAEYDELTNVKQPANARAIAAAREHGDLRENADYQAAMEERDLLRNRQIEMQRELNLVRELTPRDVPVDHVGIGSRVTLVNTADEATHVVTLLGPWDGDPAKHIYPYRVPMYKPILGGKVGDVVELSLHGKPGTYRIDKIERGITD
jgi:transcription elongation GreA/GreB family factor